MGSKSRRAPDWFDLAKYESLRDASLDDWYCELKHRRFSFQTLSKYPTDPMGLATWETIRTHGSLTGCNKRGLHALALSQRKLFDSGRGMRPSISLSAGVAIQLGLVIATLRERLAGGNGSTPGQGRFVSTLTMGDVALRLVRSGDTGALSMDRIRRGLAEGATSSAVDSIGRVSRDYEAFARIDLSAPDERIRAEFNEWLQSRRQEQASRSEPLPTPISEADLDDWRRFQILPYLDLTFAMRHEGFRLSQERLGALLFPDEIEVSLAERIRKVTRPKARRALLDLHLPTM